MSRYRIFSGRNLRAYSLYAPFNYRTFKRPDKLGLVPILNLVNSQFVDLTPESALLFKMPCQECRV